MTDLDQSINQDVTEAAKHGLYYNVNKRKKAGTSRDADSPKAPTAQAWKDAAKTAKKEGVAEVAGDVNSKERYHFLYPHVPLDMHTDHEYNDLSDNDLRAVKSHQRELANKLGKPGAKEKSDIAAHIEINRARSQYDQEQAHRRKVLDAEKIKRQARDAKRKQQSQQGVAEGGFPKKISQKEVDKFQKKHNDKLTGREVNRQEQEKKPADNTKKQGVVEGMDPTTDSARDARGDHRGEVKKNKDGSYVATNQSGSRKIFKSEKTAEAHAKSGKEDVAEGRVALKQIYGDKKKLDQDQVMYGRMTQAEFDKKWTRTERPKPTDIEQNKKQGVAEGHRDYYDNRTGFGDQGKREFKRREMEHELGHETNNYAVSINGKTWKVFGSRQEASRVSNSLERKYPDKKIGVHETGAPVSESATAGGTSAANVGVGAVYNNKPPKQPKNKDGTAKNAVDMKGVNLLTGGSLKR